MKIRLVGAKLFHADGWTYGQADVKLIVTLSFSWVLFFEPLLCWGFANTVYK